MNGAKEDAVERVWELTGGLRVDVAFEALGLGYVDKILSRTIIRGRSLS